MKENAPQLEMTFDRVFCSRHGEPLRAAWPAGYGMAVLEMFRILNEDEAFQKECGGEVQNIGEALDKKPMCCRLSQKQMLRVYLLAAEKSEDFGKEGTCSGCGGRKMGTPYRTSTEDHQHICFECVVSKMTPLS